MKIISPTIFFIIDAFFSVHVLAMDEHERSPSDSEESIEVVLVNPPRDWLDLLEDGLLETLFQETEGIMFRSFGFQDGGLGLLRY